MSKLRFNITMTLDGYIAGPNQSVEHPLGEGAEQIHDWVYRLKTFRKPYDLLLGRKTYEIFAAHWPLVTNDPTADTLNSARKYVASRTLKSADWNNSTVIKGDVAAEVAKIKEQSGPEIQVHGSGNLIQTLMKHDLIDEFRLWIFPVLVGNGKLLFADGTIPGGLKLLDSNTSTTGVVIATYERAGEIPYGSFEVDVQGQTSKLWTETQTT